MPRAIGERLSRVFGTSPEAQKAVAVTQRLYRENVFPRMNITWGTFKNNLLHIDDGGCFRCHAGRAQSRRRESARNGSPHSP